MTKVFDLRLTDDPRDYIHTAVQCLVEGGVVGVPTETVYGLAVSALAPRAIERLYEIKGRSASAPLAAAFASREAAQDFYISASPVARRLSRRCWPGPLTMVLPCDNPLSALNQIPQVIREKMTSNGHWVGFRVCDHRIISHIHRFLSAPMLLTSANISGKADLTTAESVQAELGDKIDMLLDDGPTHYAAASTIVKVDGARVETLREGVLKQESMSEKVKPLIALVCTGNTCRSPMAEVILKELVEKKFGGNRIEVLSAGVAAGSGMRASPQAVQVAQENGLDLTDHASRPLDDGIMNSADIILTMTSHHRAAILAAWPSMHESVHTLRSDGGDISDPVGMPVEVYRSCADQMRNELSQWLDRLVDDQWFPQMIKSGET
ncbi:MAG: L-threonylcarbamoyladenylate synthase [Planctomycetota bacterium]